MTQLYLKFKRLLRIYNSCAYYYSISALMLAHFPNCRSRYGSSPTHPLSPGHLGRDLSPRRRPASQSPPPWCSPNIVIPVTLHDLWYNPTGRFHRPPLYHIDMVKWHSYDTLWWKHTPPQAGSRESRYVPIPPYKPSCQAGFQALLTMLRWR